MAPANRHAYKPIDKPYDSHDERAILARIFIGEPDECWPWIGRRTPDGYGQFVTHNLWTSHRQRAHRLVWRILVGPIPAEMVIDHKCHNRICVNPNHLQILSNVENAQRNGNAIKTHCVNGHEFTPENTWFSKEPHRRPRRHCAACTRANNERASAQRRAERASRRG